VADIQTARAFINEGIEALSIEMYRGDGSSGDWQPVDPIQATLAVELERIDSALGPSGTSMFAPIAESIKQAMAALHGAKQALEGKANA
jgi:hypothetical protein